MAAKRWWLRVTKPAGWRSEYEKIFGGTEMKKIALIALTCGAVYGFCALENRWLDG